jgi:hypothetical protein
MENAFREAHRSDAIKVLGNRHEDASAPTGFAMAYVIFRRSAKKMYLLNCLVANVGESGCDGDGCSCLSKE